MSNLEYIPKRRSKWKVVVLALGIIAMIWGFFALSDHSWKARLSTEPLDLLKKEYAQNPLDNEICYYYSYRMSYTPKDNDSEQPFRVMTEVVKRRPDVPRYWLGLARCASVAGRSQDAVEAYRKALALDPHQASAHASLGQIYGEAGLTTEALQEYDQALKQDPKVDINRELLANCLLQKDRYAEAWDHIISTLEVNPFQDTSYLVLAKAGIKLEKWDEAEARLMRRIAIATVYPVNLYEYCMAQVEFAKPPTPHSLDEADKWLQDAIKPQGALRQGVQARFFALYARVLDRQHREKEAYATLEAGLKLSPSDPDCLKQMKEFLERKGDTQQAAQFQQRYLAAIGENEEIASLRKTIAATPQNATAQFALASALERIGRYGEASEHCHAVLASDPHRTDAAELQERCRKQALDKLVEKAAAKKTVAASP